MKAAVLCSTLAAIWKARNAVIFKKQPWNVDVLCKGIGIQLISRLSYKYRVHNKNHKMIIENLCRL